MSECWYVYIIAYAQGKLYTGITKDVERRFAEHSASGKKAAKALRGKGPYKLVYTQAVENKSAALRLEYAIKKMTRTEKLVLIEQRSVGDC